ncbi:MAG: Ycf51 family protein [Leptolyngbyaceae cyanobacterium MO_188.B28]|nr:Ycf51 family protein [Leptolyngbyaceae cyanobacterium MO_188.B28]
MLTPEEFLEATKWAGIATLVFAAITALAFVFGLGFRFRLVGVTGFLAVLAAGFFGLSFEPLTRTQISGAIPYTTVYDSGMIQVVIKVPDTITEPQLKATLKQAASNLFKPGRLGSAGQVPTIRARTILHEKPGVTRPLYLGQVQPIPDPETGEAISIEIFPDRMAQLPQG